MKKDNPVHPACPVGAKRRTGVNPPEAGKSCQKTPCELWCAFIRKRFVANLSANVL
jgi:hypothetical protein